ncbi:MAG: EamA family transporter [Phycisphaeraceae bacterium]|nr:EamA family transporter [Phycisphaerales bacterium]MCB9841873.1 EamA family transporter [Phycisphaeraceae bacterium]
MMQAVFLAVCAGLCWGIGEMFTKQVLHSKTVGPITAITIRSTVALPVLWVAYFVAVRWMKAEPGDWWRASSTGTLLKLGLGSGLVAGAAAMIFFYSALSRGQISVIKPIAFTLAPACAVMLGWLVLGEPMSVRKGIALAMILGGVVLLTGK